MTIKEQADALIDKYRPYAYSPSGLVSTAFDTDDGHIETRNAIHCALKEVEARKEEYISIGSIFSKSANYRQSVDMVNKADELTALETELKSRL